MSSHFLNAMLGAALAVVLHGVAAQPKPPADKAPKAAEKKPATREKRLGMENAHAMCIGCHGIPGYKTAFPSTYHVPKIAGQQPGYIVNALKAYKSGERSHPSMRGIAASLTEEDMKELADYYGGGK
jgi:cytochrome c553